MQRWPSTSDPRGRIGWALAVATIVLLAVLSMLPAPYVIRKPGPSYDVLGTQEVTDDDGQTSDHRVITISGAETYPTEGELRMTSVSILGNRERGPSWLQILAAWVRRDQAVMPVDTVYPAGVSAEERDEATSAQMTGSQRSSVAAALTYLGIDYSETVTVSEVPDDVPAAKSLEAGDRLVSVDGAEIGRFSDLTGELANVDAGDAVRLVVERDGAQVEVDVTTVAGDDGTAKLGIVVSSDYDFPMDVDISLDDVGGPSAGTIFALGVIDELTPGSLIGDNDVAGTGTITADGEVGAISGIRQKMVGARQEGATWFLAPADNCDEVVGYVPDGMTAVKVSTLTEAVDAAEAIASGDTSGLAQCN